MKHHISILGAMLLAAAAPSLLTSCSEDEPLYTGEGVLKMKMVVNSTLTRAESNQQELADKCVVYVSGTKGLLYKFVGLDQIPSDLYLKTGSYVAEAWTGDSVSASFDSKFYKAYEPFTISKGDVTNVVLNCKIANVVASINPEPIIAEALKDYTVTVGHSRGELVFNEANSKTAHGYFMMPNADTDLTWTITGKTEDGSDFTKSGVIPDVQRAHEYVLNIRYTPTSTEQGGGFITVTVDDTELLIEDTIELTGAPVISGVGFDIDQTIVGEQGSFQRNSVYVEAFDGLSSMLVNTPTPEAFGFPTGDFDFITMTDEARTNLQNAGVTCEYTVADGKASARIIFDAAVFNNLTNGEYELNFTATDLAGKTRTRTMRLMVSDASVAAQASEWYEIYATRATLHGTILKEDVTNPGFRYRVAGSSDEWTIVAADEVAASARRRAAGQQYSTAISGLTSGTRYEYQAICDGYVNPLVLTFTTESFYTIPNAGLEDWAQNSKGAWIPSASGNVEFWDSGNHGSITMSKNVTQPVTAPVNSGTYAAELKSQFVGVSIIGKFAAGNLFAGSYDKTDGTNGELTFGREYNGSRPAKLRGHIYYHPGTVDYSETSDLEKGQTDIGTVYVALTTAQVSVKTKTKELFDPTADYVVAYGAMNFTSDYGTSTALQEFEITLEYDRAREILARPSYLVIVASASKYGDYFTGSTESVLVLDDLEFVY